MDEKCLMDCSQVAKEDSKAYRQFAGMCLIGFQDKGKRCSFSKCSV